MYGRANAPYRPSTGSELLIVGVCETFHLYRGPAVSSERAVTGRVTQVTLLAVFRPSRCVISSIMDFRSSRLKLLHPHTSCISISPSDLK